MLALCKTNKSSSEGQLYKRKSQIRLTEDIHYVNLSFTLLASSTRTALVVIDVPNIYITPLRGLLRAGHVSYKHITQHLLPIAPIFQLLSLVIRATDVLAIGDMRIGGHFRITNVFIVVRDELVDVNLVDIVLIPSV